MRPLRGDASFVARWPIADDTLTLRELVDEALETLPGVAAGAGAVLTGRPVWRVDDTRGGGPHLVCTVPALAARSHAAATAEADTAAARGGSLVAFTPCKRCDRPAGGRTGLCETHRQQANKERRAS